jgi:hypothetical protein
MDVLTPLPWYLSHNRTNKIHTPHHPHTNNPKRRTTPPTPAEASSDELDMIDNPNYQYISTNATPPSTLCCGPGQISGSALTAVVRARLFAVFFCRVALYNPSSSLLLSTRAPTKS